MPEAPTPPTVAPELDALPVAVPLEPPERPEEPPEPAEEPPEPPPEADLEDEVPAVRERGVVVPALDEEGGETEGITVVVDLVTLAAELTVSAAASGEFPDPLDCLEQ